MTGDTKTYFESLNGLRGLAAVFILLFHSIFPCFRALWIGVPMFFVLSGFLITRILIQNKTAKNYLKAFYLKRSLRIFPIYYLGLLVSVSWGLIVNADLNQLPVFIFYLQNFTISQNVQPDYCYGLMNHTWSLSVEELFYLFWPLIILVLNKKTLIALSLFIGLSCILYKTIMLLFFYTQHTDQLLMLSLTGNIDGLMTGAVLGVLSLNKNSFIYRLFPLKFFSCLIIIFLAVFIGNYGLVNDSKNLSFFKALLSVFTVVISFYTIAWLISHRDPKSFYSRIFNNSFLQFTGKLSYGLYLYHALVFGITGACIYHFKININPILLLVFKITITYIISVLSWHFIEIPFLSLKDKINYKEVNN